MTNATPTVKVSFLGHEGHRWFKYTKHYLYQKSHLAPRSMSSCVALLVRLVRAKERSFTENCQLKRVLLMVKDVKLHSCSRTTVTASQPLPTEPLHTRRPSFSMHSSPEDCTVSNKRQAAKWQLVEYFALKTCHRFPSRPHAVPCGLAL